MTDFTKMYAAVIVYDLFKKIRSHEISRIKANKTSMELKQTAAGVRTSRHWKSVEKSELCTKEIEKKYKQLIEMDVQTGWSQNLHQDRFKFVDKYPEILEEFESQKERTLIGIR